MDSVDKLREYAAYNCRVKGWKDDLKSLADGIEAEVESEYMKLPVDVDGVPIRVGDKIEHRGHTGDVWLFGANEIMCTDRVCYPIGECRHVKPRTLEDVLHDFWEEWESHPIDAEWGERLERLRESEAKYADEIRELLAGDAE